MVSPSGLLSKVYNQTSTARVNGSIHVLALTTSSKKNLGGWMGWGGTWIHVPTFGAESKSAKIQNSVCPVGRWGGGGIHFWLGGGGARVPGSMFQLFDPGEGGGGEGGGESVQRVLVYGRHLVRIWGELKNFEKNFFHSLRLTASQKVSCGD